MKEYINNNLIRASNLVRISAVLTVAGYFGDLKTSQTQSVITIMLTVIFLIGIAYLIRREYSWVKWVLVALFLVGLIGVLISISEIMKMSKISLIFFVIQSMVQVIATILLFIPDKDTSRDELQSIIN